MNQTQVTYPMASRQFLDPTFLSFVVRDAWRVHGHRILEDVVGKHACKSILQDDVKLTVRTLHFRKCLIGRRRRWPSTAALALLLWRYRLSTLRFLRSRLSRLLWQSHWKLLSTTSTASATTSTASATGATTLTASATTLTAGAASSSRTTATCSCSCSCTCHDRKDSPRRKNKTSSQTPRLRELRKSVKTHA